VAPWQVSRTKICECSFCIAVKATNLRSALTAGLPSPTVCAAAAGCALIAGQTLATVNGKLVGLVPPPPFPVPELGAGGLKTLTLADPALTISVLGTVAWT